MKLKDIREVNNLQGKKIFLRSDLNAPIKDGEITDDFRLRCALKTINFLKDKSAKIILAGHLGIDPKNSFLPIYKYLQKYFPIFFTGEVFGKKTDDALNNLKDGEIVFLENLRSNNGESANDEKFTKKLASFADIYVNDAFSVSHRKHSSIVGIPNYLPSYAGILLQEEINALSDALIPQSPSLCILGGVKFKTKEPLIRKFLYIYDTVYVSGALANDFFKARGFNVGKSLISDNYADIKNLAESEKIIIPSDVTVENNNGVFIKKLQDISDEDNITDAGTKSGKQLAELARNSKFILWNGTLGEYERGFIKQTEVLARAIANSSARTLIGGGDTIASINHLNLLNKFSFVSTGGGAMLQFLLDGTMLGIEALKQSAREYNMK
ncbi:phosphoglycerate kinase [Candidatus Campbellbacteria bacterium CG10_big_fil_rev_8_21_14_0_10_35_52]|uniref:Phosphoglycerate kinase n=1 Tax=Candidatus Campbellbacteria bacterium CG10_big_fil_rev_8_21_14_0_10_35_52 TaxID=1974527 RepID=A0A2M6WVR8_9BACT|nr:MAG: phosphoglycerate kinase [Candidatus Campbellbacteria bacterium CG10_big_fil_rev_8_21_14_0_10_35_52]